MALLLHSEHRVPAHGERGHRRGADGDDGKDREPGERGADVNRRAPCEVTRAKDPGRVESRWASLQPQIFGHYSQMYSSAMAPSCHLARGTIRLPFSSSPTTQVQSPEPNPIGWDSTWTGTPPVPSTKACIASMRARMPCVEA